MLEIAVILLIIVNFYFYKEIRKEKKKLRILSDFIDGLVIFTSKTPGMIVETIELLRQKKELSFGKEDMTYGENIIYDDIKKSLQEDFWAESYKKFIEKDRLIFWDDNSNGGFQNQFLKVHDRLSKEFEKEQSIK